MVKVAFIICYNNELYMRECMDYISWLKVPEGVETEIIGITEAESMAAGYNAAMHESDAKYKVYLHQDVFILNEDFIQDIINIFEENPEYGMLGVMGSTAMVSDANYWLKWDTGAVYADNSLKAGIIEKINAEKISETIAIDGMIMITQYDVEWRADIFDGFDFYDISQSAEFQKAGYKVGIPQQKKPWCNHVCGHSKMERYDVYRKKFCEEYKTLGYCYSSNVQNEERRIKNKEIEKRLPLIEKALEKGELDRVVALLNVAMQFYMYNTQLCNLYIIVKVIYEEKENNIRNGFWVKGTSIETLLEKYILYKFLLKRLEYNKPIENLRFILEWIAETDKIGLESEKIIAKYTVENVERVIWKLKWELQTCFHRYFEVEFDDEMFSVLGKEDGDAVQNMCRNIQCLVYKLKTMGETIDYGHWEQTIEMMFEGMESIGKKIYAGQIDENLYMAYFYVIEKHENMAVFLKLCQEWLDRIGKIMRERGTEKW